MTDTQEGVKVHTFVVKMNVRVTEVVNSCLVCISSTSRLEKARIYFGDFTVVLNGRLTDAKPTTQLDTNLTTQIPGTGKGYTASMRAAEVL